MDLKNINYFHQKVKKYDDTEWNIGGIMYNQYLSFNIDNDLINLYYCAKKDNISLFNELFPDFNDKFIDLYTNEFTTGLISDYFKKNYDNKFLYSNDQLYYYNEVYWVSDDKKNSHINNFIDKEFYLELTEYCQSLINKYSKTNQNKNEKVIKLLNNVQQLRKIKFRKMLIDDIINKITDNKIIFDSHSHLFCFRNKLFNLNENKFIEPIADYYIKTIADYDYNDKYNKINIEELENLIKKILPDTQTRKYYMEILSTGLYGERIENCFICIGKGGNGKSLLNGLMLKTVSKYGYKAPSSLVISPIKEGGNPAVYNMNKKRFILVSEPDEDAKFNSGTMKELTGDGIINSRTLYKSNDSDMIVEIKMTFVIESNDIPKLNKIDDGILRRFRNIPFVSRFVSDEKYDTLDEKTNVYRANQEYKTDKWQDEHKQALFEILRNHFINFKNNNYKICIQSQEAKISTNEYLLGCDDVYDWFISKYQLYNYKDEKEEIKYIKIKDMLYEDFIRSDFYLSLNYTQKRKLNLKDFIKRFENTLGEYIVDDYYIKENGINKRIYVKSIKNFVLIE